MRHWFLAASIVLGAGASAYAIEMFGDWTNDSRDGIYTITHPSALVRDWPCDLTPVTRGRREMPVYHDYPQAAPQMPEVIDAPASTPAQYAPRGKTVVEDYQPNASGLFPAPPQPMK